MFKFYIIVTITLLNLIIALPLLFFWLEEYQLLKTETQNTTTALYDGEFTERLTEKNENTIETTNFTEEILPTSSQSTLNTTTADMPTIPVNSYSFSTESETKIEETNTSFLPNKTLTSPLTTETVYKDQTTSSSSTLSTEEITTPTTTVQPLIPPSTTTGSTPTTTVQPLIPPSTTTGSIQSTESTTVTTTSTTSTPLMVPFKSNDEWYPYYPSFKCLVPLSKFVRSVLIRQTLKINCFTADDCFNLLKDLFGKDKSGYTIDINYNFIIGGDGVVYEARGFTCRADNPTRFYTPPIDELHIGLTGNAREGTINNIQLENMKKFLYEGSQQGSLKKFVDGYSLKSFHDTLETCSCPLQQPATVETCGPCVLKRLFPQH